MPRVAKSMTCHVTSRGMETIEELRYLVLGAQREGARSLAELLQPAGLTAAQAEVIAVLRDADRPLTVREVGDRLVCEGGSPSRLTPWTRPSTMGAWSAPPSAAWTRSMSSSRTRMCSRR